MCLYGVCTDQNVAGPFCDGVLAELCREPRGCSFQVPQGVSGNPVQGVRKSKVGMPTPSEFYPVANLLFKILVLLWAAGH